MPVSKLAGFYPRSLAKAIVKGVLRTQAPPMETPIYIEDLEDEEPPKKKSKTSHEETSEPMRVDNQGTSQVRDDQME